MTVQLILNRYHCIMTAGSGGFATVVVAWDPRIQRKVAIKIIPLSAVDAARADLPGNVRPAVPYDGDGFPSSGIDARTAAGGAEAYDAHADERHWLADIPGLDEARTAAMLQDPNIVTVYDFEICDRRAYLIMEYVEGITLKQLLADHGDELTLDTVAAVFAGVAGALEAAHRRKVLHLDIKPANILINGDGQVKVTDFGLATLADAQGFGTAGGGTVGYMPLEQMRQGRLDVRTDEWALASVTYEMLTGRNPFDAPDLQTAEEAIEEADLLPPSAFWDELDPEADDILFDALSDDPADRFRKIRDFCSDLLPLLGDVEEGTADLIDIVGDELAARAYREGAAGGYGSAFGNGGFDEDGGFGGFDGFGGFAEGGALDDPDGEDEFHEPSRLRRAGNIALRTIGAAIAIAVGVLLALNGQPLAAAVFAGVAVLWWVIVARLL